MTKMKKNSITYEIEDSRVEKLLKRGFEVVTEKDVKNKKSKTEESNIEDENQSEGD